MGSSQKTKNAGIDGQSKKQNFKKYNTGKNAKFTVIQKWEVQVQHFERDTVLVYRKFKGVHVYEYRKFRSCCANYNFLQVHDSKTTKTLDKITHKRNYKTQNRQHRYATPLYDE